MSTGKHTFRHSDAARLIRAAQAAGLTVRGVTLDGHKVTLEVDGGTATGSALNPWDGVLTDDPDAKRTA
jgi:hypothetical protein